MYPTEHYFRFFPQEWKEQYPDMPPMTHLPRLGIGLYALTLGIGTRTGLYQALVKTHGAESANGLMDYEMYALLSGFNCKEPFSSRMADQMLFSIMPRKDDWYRELFRSGMDEEKNEAFRRFWFNACLQQGIRDVYLCLSDMNRVPEVFCIWVICGSGELKGLPFSYFTVGKDGSTFKEVLESLGKFGLNVLGVLSNSDGCREMTQQYGQTVANDLSLLMDSGYDFGVACKDRKFLDTLDLKADTVLLYNMQTGHQAREKFVQNLQGKIEDWNEALEEGPKVKIPPRYRDLVALNHSGKLWINPSTFQKVHDARGCVVLASSLSLSAQDTRNVYILQKACQKGIRMYRTSLRYQGYGLSWETEGRNLLFASFLGAVIWWEIQNSCQKHKLHPKRMITRACELPCSFTGGRSYEYLTPMPRRLGMLFSDFDLDEGSIRSTSREVGMRFDAEEARPFTQKPRTITLRGSAGQKRRKGKCS